MSFWLPTLEDVARAVLKSVAILTLAYVIFAAGESNMARYQIRAIADAEYCAATLHELLTQAERAARFTDDTRRVLIRRLSQRVPATGGVFVVYSEALGGDTE